MQRTPAPYYPRIRYFITLGIALTTVPACTVIQKTGTDSNLFKASFQGVFTFAVQCFPMKLILAATGILFFFQASSQSPAYNQFTTREGLSGNTVYCGLQDKKGFLWFGTDQGLSRFDGSRFEQFGVREGLPDPEVLNLFSDTEGDLWISCFKENVCRRRRGVIQSAANEAVMAKISLKSSIVNVTEDDSGKKWISGKDHSIFLVDGDSVVKKTFPTFVSTVFQMQGDLFAISSNGVFKLQPDGSILKTIPIGTPGSRPFGVFYGCVVSGDKLMVTSPHVMLFQREGDQFRLLEENRNLSGKLYKDSRGQIWLGSPFNGAICFKPGLKSLQDYQLYLPGKRINAVIEDNQGGFWFGTIGEGVFRLSPSGSSVYPLGTGAIQVNVTALSKTREGNIWAADDRGMVYSIGPNPSAVLTLPGADKYNKSRAMLRTSDNSSWIGTDKGLFRIRAGKVHQFEIPSAVKAMVARNDTLWIGSANSIYMLPASAPSATDLMGERITAMCIDREGWIWTGGTKGLKCEKQQFKLDWSLQFPELNHKIIALGTGVWGYIWASTPQNGLLRIQVEQGKVLRVEPMDAYFKGALKNVQSIFCEPTGRVWLATNQGIYALDPDLKTQYFGIHDGLSNIDVNCLMVFQDTLWAGTVAGVTAIPLSASGLASPTPVLFSALRYRIGSAQQVVNLLDDPAKAPVCSIPSEAALTELVFSVQDYNGYFGPDLECLIQRPLPPFYALTFDHLYQWFRHGCRTYTETGHAEKGVLQFGMELPPGKYLIKAIAKNKTGNYSSESEWLSLEKASAWHETLLFWLLFWGLMAWVALKIIRDRSQYRKMRMQVAELRVQALQAQMNPHFIGNSINAIQQFFYPPNAAKASRYIAIFTRLLRKTMELTEQHFISLKEELQYTDDYLQLAQLRYEDRFQYQIDCADAVPETTPFPGMILQPLLENATIHGMSSGQTLILVVQVRTIGEKLICSITDNGPGIFSTLQTKQTKPSQHQSRGLEILKKKIQTLNMLHKTDLVLSITDRSTQDPALRGTVAEITFSPLKIPVA